MTIKLLVFLALSKLTGLLYAVTSPRYTRSCMGVAATQKMKESLPRENSNGDFLVDQAVL
jgi:hypothetical protein